MEVILGQLKYVVYALLFLCGLIFYYRAYYNRLCRDNILCEFVTDEGTGYSKFYPVIDGILNIPPSKKRTGAQYPVGNITTYNVNYPSGVPRILSFMQTQAKKCSFDERTAEPLTNRSACLLLTPQALYGLNAERFTGMTVGRSLLEEKEIRPGQQQQKNTNTLKIVIFAVLIIGVAVGGFFLFQYLGHAKAALGVS